MKNTHEFPGYRVIDTLSSFSRQTLLKGVRIEDGAPILIKAAWCNQGSSVELAKAKHAVSIIYRHQLACVPKPIEIVEVSGAVGLVMHDVGARPLVELHSEYPLQLSSFLQIAIALSEVVQELYANGIKYIQIRPETLLVDQHNWAIKLADVATTPLLIEAMANTVSEKAFDSVVLYAAPEQSGRTNQAIDHRSNLYSLGALFYQMLTGKPVFESDDFVEIMHSHLSQTPQPPAELNQVIPLVLEQITLKLLSKHPKDRYQSSWALLEDLNKCASWLTDEQRIPEFTIGQGDGAKEITFPSRVYGRQEEISALLDLYDGVQKGQFGMAFVAGYSGIGKSTLVAQINRPMSQSHGYFVSGKYDQLKKNRAYSALLKALRQLCLRVLSEPEEALMTHRARLLERLKGNGRLITDAIPEAEILLGAEQPQLSQLPVAESQNRFRETLAAFVSGFATKDHPVTLFIDDLQWADGATTDFIAAISESDHNGYLYFIGAYRDSEVGGSHPLRLFIEQLKTRDIGLVELRLGPLDQQSVNHFVADTLQVSLQDCHPLSEVIAMKTGANPFFIRSYISYLADESLIYFDSVESNWSWKLDKIQQTKITENVVELLAHRIKKIPRKSQKILQLAGCIGSRFSLDLLARVSGHTISAISNRLVIALTNGFVFPLSEGYQLLGEAGGSLGGLNLEYRFAHDRVQQAAYSQIGENARKQVHLKIARALNQPHKDESEGHLFEIAEHYNQALPVVVDEKEREVIKRINLVVAGRAMKAVAYDVALELLETAISLFKPDAIEQHYQETIDAHLNLAECYYILGDYDKAQNKYQFISRYAKDRTDLARLYDIQLRQSGQQGQNKETLERGSKILSNYGVKFIAEPSLAQVIPQLAKSKWMLKGRDIPALVNAPPMTDENATNAINVLLNISATAYVYDANTMLLLVNKMTQLSIRYGNAPASAFGYGLFGFIEGAALGNFKNAEQFSELSMALIKNISDPIIVGKVKFLKCFANQHWYEPISKSFDLLNDAYKTLYNNGSYVFAAYTLMTISMKEVYAGLPLQPVYKNIIEYSRLAEQVNEDYSTNLLAVLRRFVSGLSGEQSPDFSKLDEGLDPVAYASELKEKRFVMALSWFHVYNQVLAYLFGDIALAFEHLKKARMVDAGAPTTMAQIEHHFFNVLVLSDCYSVLPATDRPRYRARLLLSLRQLKKWAQAQPDNFLARYFLAKARWQSVKQGAVATALFQQASEAAASSRNLFIQAISAEVWGKSQRQFREKEKSRANLIEARDYWDALGANRKTEHLVNLFPDVFQEMVGDHGSAEGFLDVEAVLRASRIVSSEVHLEQLLEKLLSILMQNVGAQRGFLVLKKDQQLSIEAQSEGASDVVAVLMSEKITETDKLCVAIVNYVFRTAKPIVLENAAIDQQFKDDPYILSRSVHSLLCVPVVQTGKVMGVAYFENNLASGVFNANRVRMTTTLATQAAISLENAMLYENMEQIIQERTAELADAKKRSDDLLLNILPEQTANELRSSGVAKAKYYEQVTVMFTDFVGFTQIASSLSPDELIAKVNTYFTEFDRIVRRLGVEKIKTIGDSYMAVGGLPAENQTHAADVIDAALAILRVTEQRSKLGPHDAPGFQVRIGIHTGPVIAGVVGEHKFQYDVWGDTVNTASRMESSGQPGRINLSGTTYELIKNQYTCTHRGKIKAKGKGEIDMYFLV